MGFMSRANQSGSIASFVIIGVILTAGLISAVYFVKQRGEQVRKEQAIATYEKQKSDEEKAKNNESEADSEVAVADNSETEMPITTESTEELPVTGVGDSMRDLLSVFLLTSSSIGYISSRRNLSRSL
jgi:type II secretory pathway pseudopilin PulG